MTLVPQRPIEFGPIIDALASTVERVTGITCILHEQKGQDSQPLPRPARPYMGFKLTTPAAKNGDDHVEYLAGGIQNRGGQRKMSVSFQCYARNQSEAYEYMTLWQASLELKTIQEVLRRSGIAVWLIGSVADLTQLLHTGFEARSQMDVQFGIVSNLTEQPGVIEHVGVTGTVDTGGAVQTIEFTSPP